MAFHLPDYGLYIKPMHVPVFKEGARLFRVYILIRKTNSAAIDYMGRPGYSGKRIDCKWKTANRDVGPYKLAGLVASPLIHPHAFVDESGQAGKKYQGALAEWHKHRESLLLPGTTGDIADLDLRASRVPYVLQMNPRHKHYGCVAWIEGGLLNPRYIHADYDLYALVSADQPEQRTLARQETMLNQSHVFGPQWFQFMNWIDARLGFPMIFHGEQEHYREHTEDDLIVFYPDGQTVKFLNGQADIERFYQEQLQGRQPFHK
jgi:hypothetical protein